MTGREQLRLSFLLCMPAILAQFSTILMEYIDAGIPPPNSPVTLSGGWIYNRVAKKGVLVKGKSGSTPLVDTGQLRADFDFEITER